MKKIFFSTWVLVTGLFFLLSQGNTLLFGAEKMMEKGATAKEKMKTGNTMKTESGMMKEDNMMKEETGMKKEQKMIKKETGMMKEDNTMQKETGMMKENKQ
jgi:hypothetical protein